MKRMMYSLCVMISTLAVPVSCNDDNGTSPNRELLLTEVARNGFTRLKLFYDTERLLTRTNAYFNGNLTIYTLYEYNDKGIVEARRYHGDDHELELKAVFTLDNFGRVSKVDLYTSPSDFEEIGGVFNFSYDVSGRLKSRRFSIPDNEFEYRDEFTYDAAGNRINAKKIRDPEQPTEYLNHETVYTPGEKTIPEHWNDIVFLLSVTNLDNNIYEMFALGSHFKSWDSHGTNSGEFRTDATGRIFNSDGYFARQVLTKKYLSAQVTDEVDELTHEYTE